MDDCLMQQNSSCDQETDRFFPLTFNNGKPRESISYSESQDAIHFLVGVPYNILYDLLLSPVKCKKL